MKRMLRSFYESATHETEILLASDEHPNVVHYYSKEEDHQFIYLALAYCDSTLGLLLKEYY